MQSQFHKGFLTSLFNPKGMLIYIAILPQFMDQQSGDTAIQALALSAVFMAWCALVYSGICVALGRVGKKQLDGRQRRFVDGFSGTMLMLAAGYMALAH